MTVELTGRTSRIETAESDAPSELGELFGLLEHMRIPEGYKSEIVEGIIHGHSSGMCIGT